MSYFKKIIDWILFVPFTLCFVISLLIGEVLQRIALPFGRKYHGFSLQIVNLMLVASLKVFGTKLKISFPKNFKIDNNKPYLIISNHQSTIDIVLLYFVFLKRIPHFIAKVELGKWIPTVSFNLRNGHNALIERDNPRQAIKAIAEFGRIVNTHKYLAVIFPEGTRSRCGELKEYQVAGVQTFLKNTPDADIIPVSIENSWKLNPHNSVPAESFTTVSITIGDVIQRTQETTAQTITEQCHEFVVKTHKL